MNFCGIDASFTSTGVVIIDEEGEIVEQKLIITKKNSNDKYDIEHRILKVVDELLLLKNYNNLYNVYIEGISFGSRGEAAEQLAALNYFIRISLLQRGIFFNVIPPTKLKKFITGTGQAKKELMLKEVYKKWGQDFNSNDLCDAYSLARMSLYDYSKMEK